MLCEVSSDLCLSTENGIDDSRCRNNQSIEHDRDLVLWRSQRDYSLSDFAKFLRAIFIEGKDSPYANLIVIRRDSAKKSQLLQLVKALNSAQVKLKAQALFGEGAVAAW